MIEQTKTEVRQRKKPFYSLPLVAGDNNRLKRYFLSLFLFKFVRLFILTMPGRFISEFQATAIRPFQGNSGKVRRCFLNEK